MGGRPITALNICCFPADVYSPEVLADVIAGGMSILSKAGVTLLGGHTVKDNEFKFGVSVTGICHPDQILTNQNAQPGDVLILTKRIGTGVFTTGIKRGLVDESALVPVVESMLLLNDTPITIANELGIPGTVHAATDITGYGLLGHLSHWVRGANIGIRLDTRQVPEFDGLDDLINQGCVPGGTSANASFCEAFVLGRNVISDAKWQSLNDPQTSGGLCLAVNPTVADAFVTKMNAQGLDAWIIGKVLAAPAGKLMLV